MELSDKERLLLTDMQKTYPDLFANIENGLHIGSYSEVLNAINAVAGEPWNDADFNKNINNLLNIGFFQSVFDLESRSIKGELIKHEMVIVFTDSTSDLIAAINDVSKTKPPEYSKLAKKAIERLDAPAKQRIKKAIEDIPAGDIKPMQGFSDGRQRLRVGKYRIVFTATDDEVYVMEVGSRGDIYK